MAKLGNKTEVVQKEELLVFGYSCKLFRDDEKATFIDNESHLIPWMGNPSLMIDRYDVRGALYDLDSAASVGSNDKSYMSDVERKEEELSEQERYLALYHDLEATAEQEEEEKKRLLVELETGSSSFKQVGFAYDAPPSDGSEVSLQQHAQSSYAQQQLLYDQQATVHPQGYTPHPDDDLFIPPPTLLLPTGLPVPTSIKQHKIIVKTAKFIAKQGSQMEIVLKTKQANNSMFGFLSFDNYLNHYYKHIISLIKANKFREDEVPNNNGNTDGDAHEVSFNPSADAAPGIRTPTKAAVKTAPPADCSYLKLISKIRENQAKSGVNLAAATDSRPQSPLLEPAATPVISSTSATDATTSTTVITAVNTTPAAATLPEVEIPATASLSITSTPAPPSSSKPFAGLVDYPSFNRTNEDDDNDGYSLSESDSDEDRSRSPSVGAQVGNGSLVNGGKQPPLNDRLAGNGPTKKAVVVAAAKAKAKVSLSSPACSKVESLDDIRWPSPAEQMIIDKIACYIIKNGSKFEKAMKARGDSRFQFLDASHDHFPYYQLKRDLYSEVFGELISHNASKRTERANDLKSVVASVGQVSSSISQNKSWSTTNSASKKNGSGSSTSSGSGGGAAAHTICFSIKQRRDQEVTLPATSFPLESSSSEEDVDDMDDEERERRAQEREERRKWRKMKREQFEKERREKKEKDDRAKRQEEEKRLKQEKESQKLKELEEQENASGDEDLYDIFKYAQESNKDEGDGDAPSSRQASPPPDASASPSLKTSKTRRKASSDPKLRRKKAAHAFLSKLKGAPEDEPMIGPQLPPGMETMDISPKASFAPSPAPSSPSHTPPLPTSCTPPPRASCTPPPPPPPVTSSLAASAGSLAPSAAVVADDTDSLNSMLSGLPGASKKARHSRHGLLAAAVTSLLTNEDIGGPADLHKTKSLDVKHRDDSKPRRHKQKRRRDLVSSPDRSSSRQRSLASSSKKRKRKRSHSRHHHHHKKRHHRSPQGRSTSSSHRKGSSHVAKKKKSSKSSSSRKDRPKKKKSKRRRSASVSSVSSVSSSSSSSSRSTSTESSYRSRGSKRSARGSSGESGSDPEVQIISDSDDDNNNKSSGSSSRASSVVSVTSSAARREPSLPLATPASSRASSTSRDAGGIIGSEARIFSSGAASPALPPLPPIMSASSSPLLVKPLPSHFDMKTSTAMAKITEGLRAKVHALMDKKRPDD